MEAVSVRTHTTHAESRGMTTRATRGGHNRITGVLRRNLGSYRVWILLYVHDDESYGRTFEGKHRPFFSICDLIVTGPVIFLICRAPL